MSTEISSREKMCCSLSILIKLGYKTFFSQTLLLMHMFQCLKIEPITLAYDKVSSTHLITISSSTHLIIVSSTHLIIFFLGY